MRDDLRRAFVPEARELVEQLTLAALHVSRERTLTAEQRRHVMRVAHTLKGAARVVGERAIADAAHAIEDLVADESAAIGDELATRLLQQIDAIATSLSDQTPVEAPAPAGPALATEPTRSLRVELTAIDAALERVADISRHCVMLQERVAADPHGLGRERLADLDRLSIEIAQLRGQIHQLRLAPARTLFAPVERAIRDAAAALDLRARFDAAGGEHRLDADLLDAARDAIIQLARNAVAHGLESPDERRAAGKPVEGVISLTVERRGAEVAFVVTDDGRGLDLAALRQAADRAGIPGAAADDQQLFALLLEGGLTTRRAVSQISGRGVGLDLVGAVSRRYGGRVALLNRPGLGLTVTLLLPVTLRALRYLRLQSRSAAALVPLNAVRRVYRLADVQPLVVEDRLHLVIDDAPVPRVSLASVLTRETGSPLDDRVAAIVLAGDRTVALTAQHFGEVSETVAQSLPALAGAAGVIRGFALSDFGEIVPVLEPGALYEHLTGRPEAAASPPPVRRLLVVDDSITTRMLEQSILEGAGFHVDTAASAEEALDRAASTRYDLFIVDVEMPGMNGFDFVAAARADEQLAATPAMLVTSRGGDEDRRRGLAAGARAYIVKSEFDQEVFLTTVRGLVG